MSDCYCDYEDLPRLYDKKIHVARKRYRCSECVAWIEPGERYERVYGIWDEPPKVFRTCCRCMAVIEYVQAHVPCYCREHGGLYETGVDELVGSYAWQVPGMWMEYGRLRIAVRRAERKAQKLLASGVEH